MTFQSFTAPRLMLTLCAAALLSATPLTLHLDGKSGLIGLKSSVALADSGKGSGGSDGGDSSDDSSSHDGSDDHGSSHDSSSDDDSSHDSGDDHGSSGHGSDDGAGHDVGDDHGGATAGGGTSGGLTVVKFESNAQAMEVVFSDGTKEEIFNSRYERKNAAGRTVEERAATQADVDRLWALR